MPAAVITAGGGSRRFGRDKALALWHGRPLLEWVAQGLQGHSPKFLIAPQEKYRDLLPEFQRLTDIRPGWGPLAGLEVALTHAPGGWVAFAGVDQPRLDYGYWAALLGAADADPTALSVQALNPDRDRQPLGALYHTALLPRIRQLLDAGERRLGRAALAELTVLVAGLSPRYFDNINTVQDLERLESSSF